MFMKVSIFAGLQTASFIIATAADPGGNESRGLDVPHVNGLSERQAAGALELGKDGFPISASTATCTAACKPFFNMNTSCKSAANNSGGALTDMGCVCNNAAFQLFFNCGTCSPETYQNIYQGGLMQAATAAKDQCDALGMVVSLDQCGLPGKSDACSNGVAVSTNLLSAPTSTVLSKASTRAAKATVTTASDELADGDEADFSNGEEPNTTSGTFRKTASNSTTTATPKDTGSADRTISALPLLILAWCVTLLLAGALHDTAWC